MVGLSQFNQLGLRDLRETTLIKNPADLKQDFKKIRKRSLKRRVQRKLFIWAITTDSRPRA